MFLRLRMWQETERQWEHLQKSPPKPPPSAPLPRKVPVIKTTHLITGNRQSQTRLTDLAPELKVVPGIWETDRRSRERLIMHRSPTTNTEMTKKTIAKDIKASQGVSPPFPTCCVIRTNQAH